MGRDSDWHGATLDLACPRCETIFTVAATLVLDGGTAWCPGCHTTMRGDDRVRRRLEHLRRGHLAALRQTLGRGCGMDGAPER